jgi:hypothetical protein
MASRVPRAQRGAAWAFRAGKAQEPRCVADPGPFQSAAVPDQRCTTSAIWLREPNLNGFRALALHRIRDTCLYVSVYGMAPSHLQAREAANSIELNRVAAQDLQACC